MKYDVKKNLIIPLQFFWLHTLNQIYKKPDKFY
jgi:hypothetical protein